MTASASGRAEANLIRDLLVRVWRHVDMPTFQRILCDLDDLSLSADARRTLRRLTAEIESGHTELT